MEVGWLGEGRREYMDERDKAKAEAAERRKQREERIRQIAFENWCKANPEEAEFNRNYKPDPDPDIYVKPPRKKPIWEVRAENRAKQTKGNGK